MSRSLLKVLLSGLCLVPVLSFAAPKTRRSCVRRSRIRCTRRSPTRRLARPKIRYRNGPIMLGTNTLYIIYYGNFNNTGSSTDTRRSSTTSSAASAVPQLQCQHHLLRTKKQ